MGRIIFESGAEVVTCLDNSPGAGGACHKYEIALDGAKAGGPASDLKVRLLFQNGAIREAGVNGLSNEGLLACVLDRLLAFQAGPYPCQENQEAAAHVKIALDALQARTARRQAAGIEGRGAELPLGAALAEDAFDTAAIAVGDTVTGILKLKGKPDTTVTGKVVRLTPKFVILDLPGVKDPAVRREDVVKVERI